MNFNRAKLNCGFLVSDKTPSEAAYSRLLTKLSESNVLEKAQETVVRQTIDEGFIIDDTVAIDATHFEARDQAATKKEKPNPAPKKRERKPIAEREQWLKKQAEKEVNLPLHEKNRSSIRCLSIGAPRRSSTRRTQMRHQEKQ